ncbi:MULTISPECIES: cytochrome P450 [unclassified Nocardiopsis]|uniref:cytochrome P450 n=1 Tax=unclassified Nocardiopsis TaxID=2649073 RepID=UPI001F1C404E|nr:MULTISPECIES: cytochrome P450 [unclassified Nocardiopsis]
MNQRTGTGAPAGAARRPHDPAPYGGTDVPWSRLRDQYGGLAPVEVAPGVSGWLVLGYKESLQVLRDQARFSADPRTRDPRGAAPVPGAALDRDGDEHRRLRAAVVDTLARVDTPRLVPVVERAASHLLGRVAAEGAADLVGQFAAPLPALVLNELFGLPEAYGHLLADLARRRWSGDPERAEPAAAALEDYFAGLVARKRADPGEDVASRLLAHPHALTDAEAVHALSLLWRTGHEPTAHLIGNGLLRLLEDPGVWTAYLGGTLTPEDFVDYVLWTDTPIRTLPGRYATADLRLADARVRRGDPLLLGLAAAHTDPCVARGGDAMTLAGDRSHLAWGAGAHRCPATGLTRELVRTAIDTAVDRLRGMVLAVEPLELRWSASPRVHGLVELPVWFTATGERAEKDEEPAPAPVRRWVRRKRKPAPRGARYQAPLAGREPEERQPRAVPVERRQRRAPRGAGARYQAPFARAGEPEPAPDALEQLLAAWRSSD